MGSWNPSYQHTVSEGQTHARLWQGMESENRLQAVPGKLTYIFIFSEQSECWLRMPRVSIHFNYFSETVILFFHLTLGASCRENMQQSFQPNVNKKFFRSIYDTYLPVLLKEFFNLGLIVSRCVTPETTVNKPHYQQVLSRLFYLNY